MLTAGASLEDDLGKPVVSSSMGQIWWPLKTLGIKTDIKGYGKLLGTLS
jgi:maleate cis-trans isomerase